MKLGAKTIACAVVLTVSAAAPADLTYTGPATLVVWDNFGIMTPVPGGTPSVADTAGGGHLTGDVNIDMTGLASGAEPWVHFTVSRPFTVGALPVQVDSLLDVDLKFVNSLGTATHPITDVGAVLQVWDVATDTQILPLYADMWNSLAGNGIAFLNGSAGGQWILSPNRNYELVFGLSVYMTPSDDPMPPTTVTLEFGGVTGFDGVEATLTGVVVPEPCGMVLLAIGGRVLRRRRRG